MRLQGAGRLSHVKPGWCTTCMCKAAANRALPATSRLVPSWLHCTLCGCSTCFSFFVQRASAGFWPVTVAGPIMCFIKVHHPLARTQAWLHALSAATLIVTLAACVGAVYDVIDGWSTFGLFNGGG